MSRRHLALLAASLLVLGACGDDSAPAADPGVEEPGTGSIDLEESIDEITEGLQETQDAVGGGNAMLTVGDQTWEFSSVLCAFGEEMIGQEGAVFNMSAIADGLQLYASIDSFGHSLSINDIENFTDPSVALSIEGFSAGLIGAPEEFLVLDGKSVSAEVSMVDDTTDEFVGIPATFSATCP